MVLHCRIIRETKSIRQLASAKLFQSLHLLGGDFRDLQLASAIWPDFKSSQTVTHHWGHIELVPRHCELGGGCYPQRRGKLYAATTLMWDLRAAVLGGNTDHIVSFMDPWKHCAIRGPIVPCSNES